MGKQTNQYTKVRNSGNVENKDLLDLDSTDDNGVSYESAKMTMEELLKLTNFTALNYFKVDGSIPEDRTLVMNGFSSVFENGTLINKANLNDIGYLLHDSLGVEKGSLGYDVGLDSATLELKNTAGSYLYAIDGNVGFGGVAPSERVDVNGNIKLTDLLKFGVLGTVGKYAGGGVEITGGTGASNLIHFSDTGGLKMWIGQTKGSVFGNVASSDGMAFRNDIDGFYWGDNAGANTRLTKTGSLGVGILIPTEKIHVVGNAIVTGDINVKTISFGGGAKRVFKQLELGDWDMDTDNFLNVPHGLSVTEWRTVRDMYVIIRDDLNTAHNPLNATPSNSADVAGGISQVASTNITLTRSTLIFDNAAFSATSYNRGWITFWYQPD